MNHELDKAQDLASASTSQCSMMKHSGPREQIPDGRDRAGRLPQVRSRMQQTILER